MIKYEILFKFDILTFQRFECKVHLNLELWVDSQSNKDAESENKKCNYYTYRKVDVLK